MSDEKQARKTIIKSGFQRLTTRQILAQCDKMNRVSAPDNSGGFELADPNDDSDSDVESESESESYLDEDSHDNDVENDGTASVQDDKSQRSSAAARRE